MVFVLLASDKSSSSNCLRAESIDLKLFEVTAGSCGSLIHSEWRGIICLQNVISYKEQNLSQCTGKQNYVIESEENSDYYYLSNGTMIEVVFSSRVSLLVFYIRESFRAHKWFFDWREG